MTAWIKASACSFGNCVIVNRLSPRWVVVSDSKLPEVAPLTFTVTEWEAFIAGAKAGEFDLDKLKEPS